MSAGEEGGDLFTSILLTEGIGGRSPLEIILNNLTLLLEAKLSLPECCGSVPGLSVCVPIIQEFSQCFI